MNNNSRANLIEVCAITSVPFANMNRDEVNQVKEGPFGGVDRTRVSSQSLKFAMRYSTAFNELQGKLKKSLRTARLQEYVFEAMADKELSDEMKEAITSLCSTLGRKKAKPKECKVIYDIDTDTYKYPDDVKEKKSKTKNDTSDGSEEVESDKLMVLVYSREQADTIISNICKLAEDCNFDVNKFSVAKNTNVFERFDRKKYKKFEDILGVSLDSVLFGSMSASDAINSIPASMKVAHGFSTNPLVRESDYYIASDDFVIENPDKASGAGNLGYVSYSAPCLYKYAALDLDILRNNLKSVFNGEEIFKEIVAFAIKEFSTILPGGHQNSFAAFTLPSAVCVTVKSAKIPCNYANAFETPIQSSLNESISEKSVEALVNEIDAMDKCYNLGVIERGWLNVKGSIAPKNATVFDSLEDLMSLTTKYL